MIGISALFTESDHRVVSPIRVDSFLSLFSSLLSKTGKRPNPWCHAMSWCATQTPPSPEPLINSLHTSDRTVIFLLGSQIIWLRVNFHLIYLFLPHWKKKKTVWCRQCVPLTPPTPKSLPDLRWESRLFLHWIRSFDSARLQESTLLAPITLLDWKIVPPAMWCHQYAPLTPASPKPLTNPFQSSDRNSASLFTESDHLIQLTWLRLDSLASQAIRLFFA